MVVNEYAGLLVKRGALETIASRLAPTGKERGYLVMIFQQ
ncbi:hypothetical protein J3D47_002499 [Pseudomonas laurylsulfativorans]|nr:hypothetical protein [Pseudomonas laurylsulfativorans]